MSTPLQEALKTQAPDAAEELPSLRYRPDLASAPILDNARGLSMHGRKILIAIMCASEGNSILGTPLEELLHLQQGGPIKFLADLTRVSTSDLQKIKSCGEVRLNELVRWARSQGVEFVDN